MADKQPTKWIDIDDVELWERNPNEGDIGKIMISIRENGFNDTCTYWNGIVKGGNHSVIAIRNLRRDGWHPDKCNVTSQCLNVENGTWEAAFIDNSDMSEIRSDAFALALNRTQRSGMDDPSALAELLQEMANSDEIELLATGFSGDELDDLLRDLGQLPGFDIDREAKPNPRDLPLDMIYTQTFALSCCLAVQAGFKYGVQSTKSICPMCGEMAGHELVFVDNDYFNYNHNKHRDYVARFNPKYCTVMDVMTAQQCEKDNIEYKPLEQILEWAEELDEYAENVIVIPKYDCLDDIPDKFMLGYSVPTSHGGTPLPPEMFRGRRVHLLGGSWKAQLAHMAVIGDDVVSLDNNYIGRIAQLGGCVLPDGMRKDLPMYGIDTRVNPQYISLAISLGNIGWKINELYPKAVEVPAINQNIGEQYAK